MLLMTGSQFICLIQRISEKDFNELRVNDSGDNEGTICLVNESMGAGGMVFQVWARERAPLNTQCLVLRIGDTDFLHCWVADSIWLERAESSITKR